MGVKFLPKASLQSVHSSIIADVHDHAYYTLYNHPCVEGETYTDSSLSTKSMEVGPLENYSLCDVTQCACT